VKVLSPLADCHCPYQELYERTLNNEEVAEMATNLTMFIEMLAEIDQQNTELSNHKHEEKEEYILISGEVK